MSTPKEAPKDSQPRRQFINTLSPHADLFARAERRSRRMQSAEIAFAIVYGIYFIAVPAVAGRLTYDSRFPQFVSYLLLIIATAAPLVALIAQYSRKSVLFNTCDNLVKEFLDANGAVRVDMNLIAGVEELYAKYEPAEVQRRVKNMRWSDEDTKSIQIAAMVLGLCDVLYLEKGPSESASLGYNLSNAYWLDVDPVPILILGANDYAGAEWIVVTPLNSVSNYASIYVDALNNGSNIYLDPDNKVNIIQIEGVPYGVYAGIGGDADAYKIVDELSLDWLRETEIKYDFEVYNNLLILRRSLPSRRLFSTTKYPHSLFNPLTIDAYYLQIRQIMDRLPKRRAHNTNDMYLLPFAKTWHNHITYSRSRYLTGLTLKRFIFGIVYLSINVLILMAAMIISMLIVGLLGKQIP